MWGCKLQWLRGMMSVAAARRKGDCNCRGRSGGCSMEGMGVEARRSERLGLQQLRDGRELQVGRECWGWRWEGMGRAL